MFKKAILFLIAAFISFFANSQVKVGEWKDHLSYNSCNTVAKAGNIVYVSNGIGLLKYNTDDNSVERLNKINGLSDIGISVLRYNPNNKTLLIIYSNANIDVIKDNVITNFPDIKLKTITGKKYINEAIFKNNLAYLSCGFGIVVFDTDKLEVKDTYYIGAGGSYLNVYQIAFTDSTIFAATNVGMRKANLSTLLNNFQNWSTVPGIPAGTYNGVVRYLNKIVTNYSPYAASAIQFKDTLYSYDGSSWSKETIKQPFPYTVTKLIAGDQNYLCLTDQYGYYEAYDNTQTRIAFLSSYSYGYANISDVYIEQLSSTSIQYWIADLKFGFFHSFGAYPYFPNDKISLNGTHSNLMSNIDINEGKVACAPIATDETGAAHYNREGLAYYDGTEWQYIKETIYDTIKDLNHVVIDRKDPNHIWASSWIQGLCEYKNGQLVKVYNSYNSVIPHIPGYYDWHRASGLAMDKSGNLWIGSSDVQNFLSVRKTDGSLINFDFSTSFLPQVGRVLADKNDQIWVLFPRGNGIAVYKNSGFGAPNSSNTKFLTSQVGQGKLPDSYVYSIAEDLDGHIWIGTSKGVAVFYNPTNIFNGGNYDCQQILITQDSHVQILLETEKVTTIAVDGANRKWIGTEASGLFCFSPDGQTQIYHFTKEDSPIFSNNIIDVAYDEVNGDIFVGTEQGLQSYRTSIIKGQENFTEVHAYPNPVRPGYAGNVYVRGLVDQTVVKITDVAGNLVWETKSQGGQIEWPMKNLQGQRVASGVYMAYCATTDGAKSAVTKILVVN